MWKAIIISQKDNVVISTEELQAGEDISFRLPDGESKDLHVREDIPLFHKIALKEIKKNEKVIKYGEYIGLATQDIKEGDHIHTHNLSSSDELKKAKEEEDEQDI